jgi:hypothetical protein
MPIAFRKLLKMGTLLLAFGSYLSNCYYPAAKLGLDGCNTEPERSTQSFSVMVVFFWTVANED